MSPGGCCCFPVRRRDRNGAGVGRRRRQSEGLISMPSNPPTSTTWVPPDGAFSNVLEEEVLSSRPPVPNTGSSSVSERQPAALETCVNFSLRYCGMLESAQGLGHSEEDHEDLVMTIGQAQVNGQFKFSDIRNDRVILNLSRYGIKVMEAGIPPEPNLVTRWRHSLLEVIRMVHFVDVSGKTHLAIKLGRFGEDLYDSLLFECEEELAQKVCNVLRELFNAVCSPDE